MAVSANSQFNSGIQGIPGVGADVDIFDSHTTPKFAIGTRFTRSDGAEFVYSHFGAAVGFGGVLVAQDLSESASAYGTTTTLGRIYASGSTTAIAGETIRPGTAGSHYVELKVGGISADRFAGGYFQTVCGDGGFFEYRIKGNTASSAKTSGAAHTYYLELYEPLQQTVTGNTAHRILGSKYANLESASAAGDQILAGVTTCSHAAATYGWVRTLRGVVGIRTNNSYPGAIGSAICLATGGFASKMITSWNSQTLVGYTADAPFAGVGLLPVDCVL